MFAESPRILLICLVATTVLGAVMGYCVSLLRAKSRARDAINAARFEMGKQSTHAELDLESAQGNIASLKGAVSLYRDRATKSSQREEALELHSQLQAQRISTLEAQLSTYEDQQIRLQRDFASYKSNKSRELELARNNTESWSEVDNLPTLSKRIDNDLEPQAAPYNKLKVSESAFNGKPAGSRNETDRLSKSLSRELDIPTLSESELPDSVDGLEFELVDMDETGAWPRG